MLFPGKMIVGEKPSPDFDVADARRKLRKMEVKRRSTKA